MGQPNEVPFWRQFLVIFSGLGATVLAIVVLGPLAGWPVEILIGAVTSFVVSRCAAWLLHVRVTWGRWR